MNYSDKRSFGPKAKYNNVKYYKKPSDEFIIIGGPCSVENEDHIFTMAEIVSKAGATHLRGGVFRAGTYPGSSFGWVPEHLIKSYSNAAKKHNLKNIIEVLEYSEKSFDLISNYCDVFQVGARSQQNYSLLRKLGQYSKPVFLKRNTGCTVDEWLGSAEHLLVGGVKEIYLIERGSSTFHNDVRWTPCVHVIGSVKSISDIPVIMDASHGTGRSDLVESVTLAGVAAGAQGILVECHTNPVESLSDAEQAVDVKTFERIITKSKTIRSVLNEMR